MHLIRLYSRNIKGGIKVWTVDLHPDSNKIIIGYGNLDSKYVVDVVTVTMKTRTAEINSRVAKKRKEGYKDIDDILKINNMVYSDLVSPNSITNEELDKLLPKYNLDDNFNIKPMRCAVYSGNMLPCFVQPKINGVRSTSKSELISTYGGLFKDDKEEYVLRSKNGLEYVIPEIVDEVKKLDLENYEILDGELYIPGEILSNISSAIPERLSGNRISSVSRPDLISKVKYFVFDIAVEDVIQKRRLTRLEELFQTHISNRVIKVPTFIAHTNEEVIRLTKLFISQGYEGSVIRDFEGEYRFGSRPNIIQKVKFKKDKEFEIIDIIPKKKNKDMGMFVCKNDINDHTFEVNPMGDTKYQKELLLNKEQYIGKMGTVIYRERSGVKQVPFHANMAVIRID